MDSNNLVKEEDDLSFGLQVLGSFSFPMALRSAFDLGIFEILAKEGDGAKLSSKDIAIKIGTNNIEAPNMLDRLLKMLSCHSMLNCSLHEDTQNIGPPKSFYSLSPKSKCFVIDDDGVSLGPLLALAMDKVFYQSWNELNGAILEGGIPFNRIYGMNAFDYSSTDPRFNEIFNKAMFNSTLIMKKILQVYKGFEQINRLVDVGGGLGLNLKLITSKYPNLKGINFDLPHVIQHAPQYDGVEHVAGDMFESVPKGDAILMKSILHDWSDEQCLKLLKNCYKAIPENGKVIVVDSILPMVPEETASAKFGFGSDLFMMTQNPGGKERTQQEFMELATSSGFSDIKLICRVGLWVIEFFK
ncbi:hypothetical protein TanjilG_21568 [Lupinus angustifolius]|uniref:caffeate O-methyltransferase n=1 Tax=Lupinus angustifolius TaxID=3871 RepID=A0A4P1QUF8_LUPAN|nr:PREDICTED: caffeic acid 3-O-methyltransferase-like [Lupinus angustifolius]OIV95178.1 hypothetical protein TanjilG_21568 [Lupinus angustifolius]